MAVSYTGDINFDPNGVPLQIGDTGVGSLLVNGGSLESFNGPANGDGPFVQIGNQAGSTGTVTVTGASSELEFIGATFGNGMHVGNEGTGTLNVTNGALLDMREQPGSSGQEAGMNVGRRTSGDGTFILDNATADIDASLSYMNIARDGATGVVDIRNGATLTMEANQEALIQIGRSGFGASGRMDVTGGSSVTLDTTTTTGANTNNFIGSTINVGRSAASGTLLIDASTVDILSRHEAGLNIARGGTVSNGLGMTMPDGTSGDVTIQNGATLTMASGTGSTDGTYINVGRSHGPGTMTVTDSTVSMSSVSATSVTVINVARDAAQGTLVIDNSLVELNSAQSSAGIRIGADFTGTVPGADGTVEIRNGSTINMTGTNAFLTVGRSENVTASLSVTDSTINFTDTNGYSASVLTMFSVGRHTGTSGSGTATLDNSMLTGLQFTIIGGDSLNGGPTGNGMLTLLNGASIDTGDMLVGGGGTLVVDDGSILLDPTAGGFAGTFATIEGALEVTAGGDLDIVGNIDISDMSALTFGIDGGGVMGRLDQTGPTGVSFRNDYTNSLTIDATGGYLFGANDRHTIFTTTATGANRDDALFDRAAPLPTGLGADFSVTGQNAGFGWMLLESAGGRIDFLALNAGSGAGIATADFGGADFSGAANFLYDGDTGAATTTGGQNAVVGNVQNVIGTAQADALIVMGMDDITLDGGAGADTLTGGDGDDVLIGGAGADSLDGGAGRDVADYSAATTITRADLQLSGTNTGGAAGDTYTGIEDLIGGSNANSLRGDAAGNGLTGGASTDLLFGRAGDDTLSSGGGNDLLFGGNGGDIINGGAGTDTASYADSGQNVRADLQNTATNTNFAAGDSYFGIENLRGTILDDVLRGDAGNNVISGIAGDDVIVGRDGNDILVGGAGGDTLYGGAGTDRAQYTDSATGLIADLLSATANTGIAAGDIYFSVENLVGTGANDSLRGDSNANLIGGLGGNDQLLGRGGNDKLLGAGGNDVLFGGAGGDVLNGASGIDTAAYNDGTAAVLADLQNASLNTGTAAGDSYVNVENLRGTDSGDDLRGDGGANQLDGLSGNDVLQGRAGDDRLRGASGDDTMIGGSGNDTLIGGSGADAFRFLTPSDGADIITDFVIDVDTIQLDNAAFTSLSDGSLAPINFRLGTAAVDINDYIIYDGSNLYYDADANGAGAQVLIATLTNGAAIDQNDFFIL